MAANRIVFVVRNLSVANNVDFQSVFVSIFPLPMRGFLCTRQHIQILWEIITFTTEIFNRIKESEHKGNIFLHYHLWKSVPDEAKEDMNTQVTESRYLYQ